MITQTKQYSFLEYMMKKPLSFLNDMLIFIFVFSFFNDNFFVEHLGSNALKAFFVLFAAANAKTMIDNFTKMTLKHDKSFISK